MRQWGVDPKLLHSNHLLGEHSELHYLQKMLLGERKTCQGKSLSWFVKQGAVDPATFATRHDELVAEFEVRGYKHHSPLVIGNVESLKGGIDVENNLRHLYQNCPKCRERFNQFGILPPTC